MLDRLGAGAMTGKAAMLLMRLVLACTTKHWRRCGLQAVPAWMSKSVEVGREGRRMFGSRGSVRRTRFARVCGPTDRVNVNVNVNTNVNVAVAVAMG